LKLKVKIKSPAFAYLLKPKYSSMKEEGGISSGRVKSVEIRRNTKSEGSLLVHY